MSGTNFEAILLLEKLKEAESNLEQLKLSDMKIQQSIFNAEQTLMESNPIAQDPVDYMEAKPLEFDDIEPT